MLFADIHLKLSIRNTADVHASRQQRNASSSYAYVSRDARNGPEELGHAVSEAANPTGATIRVLIGHDLQCKLAVEDGAFMPREQTTLPQKHGHVVWSRNVKWTLPVHSKDRHKPRVRRKCIGRKIKAIPSTLVPTSSHYD